MHPTLHRLPPAEWPELAEFIWRSNQRADGGLHCLHAAQGSDVASHAAELAALPPDEAAWWVVCEGSRPVGVVGCEFDPALRRAWLRGPLVEDPSMLDRLLPLVDTQLDADLPGIDRFDAFPVADAAALNAWYESAGYARLQLHRVLRAAVQNVPRHAGHVRRALPDDLPAVVSLHAALFPVSYLGESDFRAALAATDRALFVACDKTDTPAGYLHVQDHPHEQEAYVDYLGVEESHRGRGLARAMLAAAADWAQSIARPHIALTVSEDRPSALNLYEHAGFTQLSAGRHWRRERAAALPDFDGRIESPGLVDLPDHRSV
jgi:ribosomal protein S18 acetylase RimI-like enzyme